MAFLDTNGLRTLVSLIKDKFAQKEDLSTVATSGKYSDLSGAPSAATKTASGLMSSSDKSKLDGVAAGANKTTVDASLTDTGTNPVQGKAVKAYVDAAKSGADAAIAGKQDALTAGANIIITTDAEAGTTTVSASYPEATSTASGLMTAAEKAKLAGIAAGAQVNSITGVKGSSESSYRTGNVNITKANVGLSNVDNTADKDKSVAHADSAGDAATVTGFTVGKSVPANAEFTDTRYGEATSTGTGSSKTYTSGLMSAADKQKLDGIAAGATATTNRGTVTSVATSNGIKGGTITSSGTVSLNLKASSKLNASSQAAPGTSTSGDRLYPLSLDADGYPAVHVPWVNTSDVTGVKGSSESAYRTGNVSITKGNIGLSNVDNTSDANKPISTATQAALDKKANSATTLAGYGITDAMTATAVNDAISSALTSAMKYLGTKAKVSDLPSSGNRTGDVWHVTADSGEYAWNGSAWESLGPVIDLSPYLQSVTVAGTKLTPTASTITRDNLRSALGISNVDNYAPGQGVTNVTRSGNTFTATRANGGTFTFTQTDTWNAMKGATASAAGSAGYVPAPAKGDQSKYLSGGGTWTSLPTSLPANGGTASNVSGTIAVAHGGTGATTAAQALSNLGGLPSTTKYAGSDSVGGSASSAKTIDGLSRVDVKTWGTRTATSTAKTLAEFATAGGGGIAIVDDEPADGQVSVLVDGTVYAKEGSVNLLKGVANVTRSGNTFTATRLDGTTFTFTQQDSSGTTDSALTDADIDSIWSAAGLPAVSV